MGILGSNYTKIHVEKRAPIKGKININSNILLIDAKKVELSWGKTKQNALRVEFEFKITYEPKTADITLNGELLYMAAPEAVEEMEKLWVKEKRLPKETTTEILNHLLSKCNLEALLLTREMNLPPPFPLPKVTPKG